jgi:hypothetical protein
MTYTSTGLKNSQASPQDNSALGQTSNSAGGISEKEMAARKKAKHYFGYGS